jgi:hypothetical protein
MGLYCDMSLLLLMLVLELPVACAVLKLHAAGLHKHTGIPLMQQHAAVSKASPPLHSAQRIPPVTHCMASASMVDRKRSPARPISRTLRVTQQRSRKQACQRNV